MILYAYADHAIAFRLISKPNIRVFWQKLSNSNNSENKKLLHDWAV
jgi:hypothetical protein